MTSQGAFEKVEAFVHAVRARSPLVPSVGIVLGSGLSGIADTPTDAVSISFRDLPGVPPATVPGHDGRLVLGRIGERAVAVLAGRVHLYEGHTPEEVVLPVRGLVALGARTVVLTNATGGLQPDMVAGDVAVVVDHLNLTGHNPLRGLNDDRLGPRFPDMSAVYDPALVEVGLAAAHAAGIPARRAVYAQVLGPSFETPAEVRALGILGADVVGMSTAIEAVAARHMGARVAAISCVTNPAAGLSAAPLGHEEVQAVAGAAAERVSVVLRAIVAAAAEGVG